MSCNESGRGAQGKNDSGLHANILLWSQIIWPSSSPAVDLVGYDFRLYTEEEGR